MAIYRASDTKQFSEITSEQRLSNQIIITGKDQSFSIAKGSFFLELLIIDGAGSVTILDGNSNLMATGVTDFSQDHAPLRCDRGVTLIGDVAMAKGFVIEGLFAK